MSFKRGIRAVFRIVVAGFIVYWVFSFMKCEIMTLKYGKEFIGLDRQTEWLDPVTSLKVLVYSKKKARVYYKDKFGGYLLEVCKDGNKWVFSNNNKWLVAVWSKQGSADGFIWPYIR